MRGRDAVVGVPERRVGAHLSAGDVTGALAAANPSRLPALRSPVEASRSAAMARVRQGLPGTNT